GILPHVVGNPGYVRAKGVLEDPDLFDAGFFGYSPADAATIDPQQRLFLECAWEALEHAAIDPGGCKGAIGVYGGSSSGTYLAHSLHDLAHLPEFVEIVLGNDKDQLTTRTSYKLDLKGPSVCVQSACSTALVAVHMACQGLLSGDCDIALAGGVSVMFPHREGYHAQDEGIYSHDGHCRAFDARATGTVPGDGVGLVVLKLLTAALDDGDPVHAVIKGTAVNNDGAAKAGFSAPGIAGQAAVIRAAQQVAGVDPVTISHVETHGTGTALGDPAEIVGLTRAFRARTDRTGFCVIGSVKSNIGHLNVAAGIAGLIKTVLALEHRILPPTLHFTSPNPAMDLDSTPFFVNTEATPWPAGATPRRAGVSSFGVGGTNAHAILEEAPAAARPPTEANAAGIGPVPHLLVLSARTATALDNITANLAAHLSRNPDLSVGDIAYTTQVGRKAFEFRRFLVCRDSAEAVRGLTGHGVPRTQTARPATAAPAVVFMLPGQGAQHAGMIAELYQTQPRFREEFDRCCDHLAADLGIDLHQLLFTRADPVVGWPGRLDETEITQPALFAVEYALAQLWYDWGVRPRALIGHSLGEYVAACLAGVFTLRDALTLVARRGQLMQRVAKGVMLSVQLPERDLGVLPEGFSVAAVNGPDLCVVSGPDPGLRTLEREFASRGVPTRRLRTSRAFHSAMMAPAARELRELAADIPARAPAIPFVSNVTGDWITDEQATDPGYWATHTVSPVRFAAGLATVLRDRRCTLLEVGPGQALCTLARQAVGGETTVVPSLRHPRSQALDAVTLEEAVGHLWSVGTPIDWHRRNVRQRRRVPLPAYPFERQRYWLTLAPGAPGDPPGAKPIPAARVEKGRSAVPPVGAAGAGQSDDVQCAVGAIWADLLGVPAVAPDDDFFLLGGHSLLGTRLIARLREAFGVEIRLRDLFELPTMAEQAALVATLRGLTGGRPARSEDNEEGEL
ncbi:MAG TPA: type I polyketide synthase, partial [Mycobacteriales bacterium]|nr:type I polyketide synthase [Mycobacteriales bacterium]